MTEVDHVRPVRGTARLRIVGWMLLLTTWGLLAAGTAVLVVESDRIDHRADRNIAQEFAELDRLLAGDAGLDSAEVLLEEALRRNVAQQFEVYLGIVEDQVRFVSYGPGGTVDDLARDPDFLAAVRALPDGGFGSVETARGEVRFGVRPVEQGDVRASYVVATYTDPWRGEFVSVMQGYALAAVLTVLVVALGGWLVAGRILRPVHDLEVTARAITETDLGRRITVSGPDTDVSRLAHTFNSMLDRIAAAFSSQRRFLDDAGHELRTPITILRGHLELLDATDEDEVEETRALLLDELDRMERLTRDLVTLATSERPDFVALEPCPLDEMTDDLVRLASALGDRVWELDERGTGTVLLDRQRITQAVLQLAANSVRYTAPGDTIAIGTRRVDGQLRLWVRDTGPGIPAEEQGRIFERFSRGSSSRGTEGSGLGLTIVRAIATAHGGRVDLASTPGEGATFTLVLPLEPEPPTAVLQSEADSREP